MDALVARIHNGSGMSSTGNWRRELRIWVTWTVFAKIAALAAIWALFFREGAS
jgi:ABC-type multidrug transport system permease subunit